MFSLFKREFYSTELVSQLCSFCCNQRFSTMKTLIVVVICLLGLGNIYLTEQSTQSPVDDSESLENLQESHTRLVNSFFNLALNSTLEEEPLRAASEEETEDTLNVDKKCFFWPWLDWLLGCTQRICFAKGAYSYIPVCGYDSTLGYRTFKNSCYLNATNTCYSTSYAINSTAACS